MLQISHLYKNYGKFQAVRDLNLHVPKGDLFGFVGPNGAGKTTTIRMVCGLMPPTEGTITIHGVDALLHPKEIKKQIGYVPDFFGVYDNLKVSEYMDFYGSMYRMTSREITAVSNDLLELVNLSDKKEVYVDTLSRGMKQRLCVARALIHNPSLLVLDEPTNGLDPNQILEIRDLIREIAQDHAVLLSTHILSEVEAICQNIKMIEHGNLIFSGTLDEFHDSVKSNTCIVKLENAPAEGELGNIPGVIKVKKLDEHSFRLQLEQEGVAEMCVNRGWRLSEMQMEKVSMDEIFAQLSGKRVVDKF